MVFEYLRSLYRRFFANDIFIAYSRRDHGRVYAHALAVELGKDGGPSVLMDTYEAQGGASTPEALLTALSHCRQLIVVASPEALRSSEVASEVRLFPKSRRSILLIEFAEPVTRATWYSEYLSGLSAVSEPPGALQPSPEILQLAKNAFQFKTQRERLRMAIIAASCVLGAVLLAVIVITSILFGVRSQLSVRSSELATANDSLQRTTVLEEQARQNLASLQVQKERTLASSLASTARAQDVFPIQLLAESVRRAPTTEGLSELAVALQLLRKPLVTVRHPSPIIHAALSPDGQCLVTTGANTARLWNGRGTMLSEWRDREPIKDVAISAESRFAAIANIGRVSVIHCSTGKRVLSLEGFNYGVKRVAFFPHDPFLATQSEDDTVSVWKLATGELAYQIDGKMVPDSQFSPDGSILITTARGAVPNTVFLWNATTGKQIAELPGRDVYCAAISPDNQQAVTGNSNGIVQVWDVKTSGAGATEARRFGLPPPIQHVVFTADRKRLAVTAGQSAWLWDISSGRQIARLDHRQNINSILLSPDGHTILTGSDDGTVRGWNAQNGRITMRLDHQQVTSALAMSRDGKFILTAGRDGAATIWSADPDFPPIEHTGSLNDTLAFSPDGTLLAASAHDGIVDIWNVATGRVVIDGLKSPGAVGKARFTSSGKYLVTDCLDATWLWNVSTGALTRKLSYGVIGNTFEIAHEGPYLFMPTQRGKLTKINYLTGRQGVSFLYHSSFPRIAQSSDGRWIAIGGDDKLVNVWETATGRQLAIFHFPKEVQAVSFSTDGARLGVAAGSSLYVFSTTSWQHLFQITHGDFIKFSFNSQGSRVSTTGLYNDTAKIWDTSSGAMISQFKHTRDLDDALFSPQGDLLVTRAYSDGIRIWDLKSKELLLRIPAAEYLAAAVFSPDGRRLALGDQGFARVLFVRPSDMLEYVCARLTFNLPGSIWQMVAPSEQYVKTCPGLP